MKRSYVGAAQARYRCTYTLLGPFPPRYSLERGDLLIAEAASHLPRGIPNANRVRPHVAPHDGRGADDRTVSDRHAREDPSAPSDPDIVSNRDVALGCRVTVAQGARQPEPDPEGVGGHPIHAVIAAHHELHPVSD